jgi:predicted alpha-1,2-mannosidase
MTPSRTPARGRTAGIAMTMVLAGAVLLPGQAASAAAAAKSSATGAAGAAALVTDPAALVNPFIGTANSGDDFPGADMPFGMVQWSPDTPSAPDGGGYAYSDSAITGFSLTHLSGPGCQAAGDIPVLPTVGTVSQSATDAFSHSGESASPGYYQVRLRDGITTALTVTTRTGMAKLTYPKTKRADLIFKLDGSQHGDSATSFKVLSKTEVQGSATSGHFCQAGNTYTIYFDMQFNRPFSSSGTSSSAAPVLPAQGDTGPIYHGVLPPGETSSAPTTPKLTSAHVTFGATGNTTVLAKVGVSYVSAANARANLLKENPGWNFATTHSEATVAWNAQLGKIRIAGGGTAQQQVFYTALYHSLLHPNVFSDDNGQYRGVDGKVHTVPAGHAFYTNFSGWDIYRTQAQLEALLDPAVASDTAQSMLDDYSQDGMLPKWLENNGESYVMVGDPADGILADYYAFGATNFNASTALTDMVAEATKWNNIRPGLHYLSAPGYLPANWKYGCCNAYGPTSSTLEYDTADFAISALAGALGNTADQRTFLNRSQDWRNVLNPDSGLVQPREANGAWASGFTPTSRSSFVEADSWIYTGEVPFDVAGLASAMGGDPAMSAYLGTVLRSYTGANGYAWVGDEPSIELPWEYDYIGEPYQTQETVRQIQDQIWTDKPGGLADGNDDLGAMSAWYVWSALGMYPMTPGTATLALGSPLFTQAVITLSSGNTLTIDGDGAATGAPYVQSATWDGANWADAYAPASAITSGGTLSYTLGSTPNTSWASAASAAPPSYVGNAVAPPQPRIGAVTSAVSSRLCLNVKGSSTANGAPVQAADCNGSDAQQWTIAPDGTVRSLGKCLDVTNSGRARKTPVDLYACNGSGAQKWAARTDGELVNPESQLCLSDPGPGATPGAQLNLYTCNGSASERWVLPAAPAPVAGAISSGVSSTLCVDDRAGSIKNQNPIQLYTCSGGSSQHWWFEPDGSLRISGHCMDVADSGTTNGTLVELYTCNGTGAQQWRATTSGQLVNTQSSLCLNDPGSATTLGTQLNIYACNGTAAQDWKIPS